jgi:hypothetical protein
MELRGGCRLSRAPLNCTVADSACCTVTTKYCRPAPLPKGHTTLHGWLGGLGARALGRLDGVLEQPVAALIVESSDHLSGKLLSQWTQQYSVPLDKYRSAPRRDRLQACARLFDVARKLFPEQAHPLFAWEKWLQTRFHVPAWAFPARFPRTAIQQHTHRHPAVVSPACPKNSKGRMKGKNHGARSPP